MVEDAEAEIRRNVNRHYQQQADIAELTTDRDHWRNEATLHKPEVERLQAKQKDAETLIDELKAGMARLHAQFETGAQIWLTGYRTLAELTQLKVVTPPALEQITHQKDSSHENEGGSNSSR
jgi:chromosome segregation ATPase